MPLVPPRSSKVPLRAASLCAVASGALGLTAPRVTSLDRALARRGLVARAADIRWIDPPSLRPRRALVLAHRAGEPSDLFVVTARTVSRDRVLTLLDVSNLTRSELADETALTVSGRWAAFAVRDGEAALAFTVVDLQGAPRITGDRGARLRESVTRLQQTGRAAGYGIERFELTRPVHELHLSLAGDTVTATLDDHAASVSLATMRVTSGERWVRALPRLEGTTGWVTWAVDTVRAVPWIGGAPIAMAEHFAFGMQHEVARARVAVVGDNSQREVAEDLADVLHARAPAAVEGPVVGWPPPAIQGVLRPLMSHEGEWSAAGDDDPFVARNPGAPPAFYQSFVRTDPERPDTRVYVTLWDPRQVELHVVPGSQEPMGATGETGSGSVPRDARTMQRLAAGFNGGFQALHGEWGVYAEGTLFLPPKPWAATIFALADGRTGFGSWPPTQEEIPAEVMEFRQNLTPLVEDGVFNPYHRTFWGGNVPGAPPGESHTDRTGICLTREGFVAFYWGAGLTERSLADAMIATRCAYGVHLDMNGANTGFEFFRVTPTSETPAMTRSLVHDHEAEGTVSATTGLTYRARRMVRGMHELGFPRYIKRDPRDYFYLLLRPVLPGASLRAQVLPAQPGEGHWSVAGLGETAFPWPMARTRIRPDPSRPDHWVNLLRVDPRRVTVTAPEQCDHPLARIVGASLAAGAEPRLAWNADAGTGRWTIGDAGLGIAGAALTEGATASRAACVDRDGFLVFVVADQGLPDLAARALDLASCEGPRLALDTRVAIALDGDRDAAGAALSPGVTPTLVLMAREAPGAARMFPDVAPVPTRIWQEAQHRRVRYQRGDDGNVRVNLVGGQSVSVRAWGGSSHPDAGATPGGTPPP